MDNLSFAWPGVLLLLPLPWIARRYLLPRSQAHSSELRLPVDGTWVSPKTVPQKPPLLDLIWLTCAWLLFIGALLRPQILGQPLPLAQEGRDIMLAVDTSGSMREADFAIQGQRVDRLSAVQLIASQFIQDRTQDRLGLILFGTIPYLQSPLTFDHVSLDILLQEAFVGMAGDATAIGDTIALAVKTLQEQPAESRVLILLTDGENTSGKLSPEEAVQLAQEIGLKIHTIGIGLDPNEQLQQQLQRLWGPNSPLARGMMNLQQPGGIDEESLQAIAEETGGQYFRATDTEQLKEIYNTIDQLETREDQQAFVRPARDLFFWPLLGSLLMLLIYLSERHTQIDWRPWRV